MNQSKEKLHQLEEELGPANEALTFSQPKRWRVAQPLGFFAAAATLFLVGLRLSGGYFFDLYLPSCLALWAFSVVGWSLITQPFAEIRRGMTGLLTDGPWDNNTRDAVTRLGRGVNSASMMTGAIGATIGFLLVLQGVGGDPSDLGAGVSVEIVSMVYACVGVLIGVSITNAANTRDHGRFRWHLPSARSAMAFGTAIVVLAVGTPAIIEFGGFPFSPGLTLIVLAASLLPLSFDSLDRGPKPVAARLAAVGLNLLVGAALASVLGLINVMHHIGGDPSHLTQGAGLATAPMVIGLLGYSLARAAAARVDPHGCERRSREHLQFLLACGAAAIMSWGTFALILVATSSMM